MLSHPGTGILLSHSLSTVVSSDIVEHLMLFIFIISSTQSAGNESPLALQECSDGASCAAW